MNPLEINPLRATRFAHLDAIGSARLTIGWRGVKHSGRELSKQGVAREVGDEYTRSEDGRPNLLTLRPAILIRTSDATTFRSRYLHHLYLGHELSQVRLLLYFVFCFTGIFGMRVTGVYGSMRGSFGMRVTRARAVH